MDRKYQNIDRYLDEVTCRAGGHKKVDYHWRWGNEYIKEFIFPLKGKVETVLDVGCGEGYFTEKLMELFPSVTGITVNPDDLKVAEEKGLPIYEMDFTFTEYHDQAFDLIFARHVFEHSFSPLLTLMEWKRLLKIGGYLALVVPTYPNMLDCVTHWFVLTDMQIKNLIIRVGGLEVVMQKPGSENSRETRYLIQRTDREPMTTMDSLTGWNKNHGR